MPRKNVRFQNKQGDWKTTSKEYNKYKKHLPRQYRSSKRTGQYIRQKTKPQQRIKQQETKTQGKINTQANLIVVKEFPNKKEARRQDVTTYEDEAGNTITIQQSEESSRYTPSQTVTVAQEEEEGTIAITKIAKRNPRKVSETRVSVLPGENQQTLVLDLEDDFREWVKKGKPSTNEEGRLTIGKLRLIAKEYNIKTGGLRRPTLEARIQKKLGS